MSENFPEFLHGNFSAEDRARIFEDSADFKEKLTYTIRLSHEEVNDQRQKLAQAMIEKDKLETELAIIKGNFKKQIEPYSQQVGESLDMVRTGVKEKSGELFAFKDFEAKQIHYYDPENGQNVYSRRMNPSEMQRSIMASLTGKTGTEDK